MSRKAAIAQEGQTKLCRRCGRVLPLSEFNKGTGMYGVQPRCRNCEHELHNTEEARLKRQQIRDLKRKTDPNYKESEKLRHLKTILSNEDSYKKYLLRGAKERAKSLGLPFNLTIEDISIPEYCPLLGIKIQKHLGEGKRSSKNWNSPSIDRLIPELGYVKGNVWVISLRANTIKHNATVEELSLIASNLRIKLEELQLC